MIQDISAILKNIYFCRTPSAMASSAHLLNFNDQYLLLPPIGAFAYNY